MQSMPKTKLQKNMEFPAVPDNIRPDLYGVTWGLKEVSQVLHRDPKYVSKYVLKANRLLLDSRRGGPVRFPTSSNNEVSNAPYRIQARRIAYWIEQNWIEIQGDKA